MIARELEHRVKNILSLVQALTSQTSVEGRTAQEFRDSLIGRLQALSKAESLIFQDHGETVDPRQIADDILEPYRGDRSDAIAISGSSVRLSARKGRMFGLALHEIATNSAKYGALSVAKGRVQLEFHVDGGERASRLEVRWQEFGGPRVTPPERKGFGTRLLEKVVGAEMEGPAELQYRSEGLIYRLSIPLE